MKLKKQIAIPSGLSVCLLLVFFTFQNCGKEAATKKQVGKQSQQIIQTNLRVDDLNNILLGMIEAEKQERIAADQDIMSKLNALRAEISTQLSIVDSNIRGINGSLTALTQRDNELSSKVQGLEQTTKNLEDSFNLKLLTTNTTLLTAIQSNKDELVARLTLIDQKIADLQSTTNINTRDIITNREQILSVIAQQKLFENYVGQNYATKVELAVQQELYKGLESVVKSLDLRLTRTTNEIADTLGQRIFELTNRVNSIEVKVAAQGKDIETLRSDLSSAIREYRSQHEELSSKLRYEIGRVEAGLGSMIMQQNNILRAELLLELHRQSLELTLYTNKAVTLLSNSLSELSKRVDKNDVDQSIAITEVRQEMVEAIAKEQLERKRLSADMEGLIDRVLRVEQDVKDLQLMAQKSYEFVNRLKSDFEQEKVSVAQRFAQQTETINTKYNELRNDFEARLRELASFAENLVKNLGSEVQQNFKNVNMEIATLSNRQANAEKRLETFLEEYQQDRSKSASFGSRISGPFRQAQGTVASAIDAITSLQFRFVQVLAPDEDTPDFYNEDLKKMIEKLNKNCGMDPEKRFVNVYGLDSFQLISIEYVKLLLTGLHSGNSKRDRMFFQYGPAGSDRLEQALIMALVQGPTNDADKSCRHEVQQWARGILLNDKRFDALSDALAEDDELERRVSVLYENLQIASQPLKDIQKHIENAVANIRDRDDAYHALIAQTALDLVNAAWDARQLSDRLAIVDEFEKMQTAQGELAEEMKNGFKELRQRLKQFEEQTNARLGRLEEQHGKMTLSLKRALDVIISLADRAGHDDLRAYARWAGEPINYTPVIYPNWSPRITTVQHFFSGKLSQKNNTDACSGSKILPMAGVHGVYQFGTWGPCWVNFRAFPVVQWGNEFQTLWLRIFGAGHLINISVDPAVQRESIPLFRNYNYNRTFDFRVPNPMTKLTGTFDNGVFDIRVPDLLDFYLKNIRSWGGVTVSILAIREDVISQEIVRKFSNVFRYTIQVFSPLILDFHKSGLPSTLSFHESKVSMNFVDEKTFMRSGWVAGAEAAFLVKSKLSNGTVVQKKDLFAEGEICQGRASVNGFDALSCLDENADGVVDANDQGFTKLHAFFDFNANGVVDEGESRPLRDLGLEKLSTRFGTIPESEGIRQGNDLRYIAPAFGKNQTAVAKIIDIYFGVEQ
jgi:hypothetical protein